MKDLLPISDVDRTNLSEEQMLALETQENSQRELLEMLRKERQNLVAEFDGDTDLKSKTLISGIKKITVLGVIKYH